MSKYVIIRNKGLTFEGSLDDAKDLAIEIRELADESGSDLSKALNDFVFAIEVAYQNHYNLDSDNWNKLED